FRKAVMAVARYSGRPDDLEPAHIGPQGLWNGHRTVGLLVVLQHRDQGAPDREARTVEGMDEFGPLLARRAVSRVHAPRLEVTAIGAGRNLAVAILARQPDLDVVGLARR